MTAVVAIASLALLGAFVIVMTEVVNEWEPKEHDNEPSKYYKLK